jgi:chromosome partition protein MukF
VERPAVARLRADREVDLEWVEPEDMPAEIERMVRRAIGDGAATLVDVTARVLPMLPENVRFVAAGRVAEIVARLGAVDGERERPWRHVRERLEIEDWRVVNREAGG